MSAPRPIDLDAWLAMQGAQDTSDRRCIGCFRTDLRTWLLTRGNDAVSCEACLRRDHAADLHEARMVRTLIGGAVRAALREEVSACLIRQAVEDAIAEHVNAEVAALYADMVRAGLAPEEMTAALADAEANWRGTD